MKNESGNALWFILIAIALLAALTVVVTRSSDTVEQSGDVERQRIAVDAQKEGIRLQNQNQQTDKKIQADLLKTRMKS